MRWYCRKLRNANVSYTVGEDSANAQRPEPRNGFQAMLVPVESQHEVPSGFVEIHIWTFTPSPFEEGKYYEADVVFQELKKVVSYTT